MQWDGHDQYNTLNLPLSTPPTPTPDKIAGQILDLASSSTPAFSTPLKAGAGVSSETAKISSSRPLEDKEWARNYLTEDMVVIENDLARGLRRMGGEAAATRFKGRESLGEKEVRKDTLQAVLRGVQAESGTLSTRKDALIEEGYWMETLADLAVRISCSIASKAVY